MDAVDFGCGTGLVTMRIQPLVRTITGVDSSQGMLDKLQDKFKQAAVTNGRTQLVDFEKGQRVQGAYDLVVSSMTLHHVRDTEAVIRHWYELIRPTGTLAFADLDSEDGSFHSDNTGVFHSGFDRKTLIEVLAQIGFRDVRDATAASITKDVEGRGTREYTVFLITAENNLLFMTDISATPETIISQFTIPGTLVKTGRYGSGLINDTYLCEFNDNPARRYILQRINTSVFKHPEEVMENVQIVTSHIIDRLRSEGVADPFAVTPALITTRAAGRTFATRTGPTGGCIITSRTAWSATRSLMSATPPKWEEGSAGFRLLLPTFHPNGCTIRCRGSTTRSDISLSMTRR